MHEFFPGQQEDEKIILFVRHHWITFLPSVVTSFVMTIIPFVIVLVASNYIALSDYRHYIVLAVSAYLLFVVTLTFVSWLDYYFDILIITDERLVHIEQNALFNRQISELNLLRIQNISTEVKGILPTFLDYGHLIVETAGETSPHEVANEEGSNFSMENTPHPNLLSKTILQLHDALIKTREHSQSTSEDVDQISPLPAKKDNDPTNPTPPAGGASGRYYEKNSDFYGESDKPNSEDPAQDPQQEYKPPQEITKLEQIADEGQLKDGEIIDL